MTVLSTYVDKSSMFTSLRITKDIDENNNPYCNRAFINLSTDSYVYCYSTTQNIKKTLRVILGTPLEGTEATRLGDVGKVTKYEAYLYYN